MEPVQTPRVFSDRYELTHLIARGGMAQVYRARDRLLDRPVALKVLFPELSVDRAFVERFRREAQNAANLSHPNIVPVFDWGEDGGTYFIVMEYVDGRPLSALLRASGQLSPERAADIAANVAAALAYAHRHGVVHRDIKPGNVIITDDGQVKVTDFGIARAVNTEESLTQTGAVMGTAAYFSPEQAEGVGVDARSDLYSLGVVLFEMLTGRTPFLGETPVAVASKHVRDQPPLPRDLNPSVPPELEAVVMKALAKSPDRRYASAEEMRADLLRFTDGRPVLAPEVASTLVAAGTGAAVGTAVGTGTTRVVSSLGRTQVVPTNGDGPPAEEEEEDDESRKRTRNLAILLGVLLLILVVVAILLLRSLGYLGGSSTFDMPNVVGQSAATATSTLKGKGLMVDETHQSSSTVGSGSVISTNPSAGTSVNSGQTVTIAVSNGPPVTTVLVPSVVGQQLTEAEAILGGENLGYSIVTQQSNKPTGQVLSQSPAAGKSVPTGTKVVLTVSSQTSAPVPNVVGQSEAAAGGLLGQAGLSVGSVSNACSNTVPNGDVISSNPSAGSSVPPQSAVSLVVSSGPCSVILKNVVGESQAQATSDLQGQQVTVTPVNTSNCTLPSGNTASNGTVVSQNPSGGTTVSANSNVTIYVCSSSTTSTTTSSTSSTTSTTTSSTTTTTSGGPASG